MKAEDLHLFMEDTSLLNAETLEPLRQIVEEYPYSHIARMLYLKNLSAVGDERFTAELKKTAIYVPDRKKLFELIEGERYGMIFLPIAESEEAPADGSFSLIDAFLADGGDEKGKMPADNVGELHPPMTGDYVYWSLSKEDDAEDEQPSPRMQHQDLIDEFIKNDGERAAGSRLSLPRDEYLLTSPSDETADTPPLLPPDDDSYFTETLAHIYIKQKRYEKALLILKNLYLNYPEKNAYFADQIRFLERLIINTKK